ncbi:MAG: UDP-2,3-diacylglucosamine diphosphatase LpxI [Candidatus Aminicenantes bacterium]|nr:UDP-2,3-diacylglucosamine diphosphatase LpxI [Candidatus Aminicenantes bacterium]
MGRRIGIIAGGGAFPLRALAEARKLGWSCPVAGLRGAAAEELEREAEAFIWVGPMEIEKLVSFFQDHSVTEAVMFGKVEHRTIFAGGFTAEAAAVLGLETPDLQPATLVKSLIETLAARGLKILDPSAFLAPYLCPEGVLGKSDGGGTVSADAAFGWPLVKALADLDIGQTMVVKKRAVVAVEGMDGTDETIRRGASLAGEGIVVLKTARTRQDARIDVPMVGLETVRVLIRVKAAALVIEAERVPFFQKDEALALADEAGLAVLARS